MELEKFLKEIGDRLRQYMNREDLAINTVAKELGLRSAQIHNILQGKSYRLEYLLAFLVQHPQLNTEWLIFGRGEMLINEQLSKETLALMRTKARIPGVSERLAEYLKKKKMSANMLAQKTNITPSVVYNIIKGHTSYKMEYVFLILLQQKDINPSWLLTGRHQEEKDPEKQKKRIIKEHSLDHSKEMKALEDIQKATKEEQDKRFQALEQGQKALEGKVATKEEVEKVTEELQALQEGQATLIKLLKSISKK